jgi:signal transduction histidine kinase
MSNEPLTTSAPAGSGAQESAHPDREQSSEGAASRGGAEQLASLRREIALRDEFISTVAHELRNPISPVYLQIEHLKDTIRACEDSLDPSWLLAQLESITTRFDRFLESLNRLLDASRMGSGHLVLMPDSCDLVEVTRGVLAAAQRELIASGASLEFDAPPAVTGQWDRLRLEQIVGNLISNAVRYGAGQPISVQISARPDTVSLSVRDRGIGIAVEDLPRIFQRFERARNVGRSAGFGIGLWVVAELCRAMGGGIEVESELGRGTAFTVTLPRKKMTDGT